MIKYIKSHEEMVGAAKVALSKILTFYNRKIDILDK